MDTRACSAASEKLQGEEAKPELYEQDYEPLAPAL